MVYRHSLTAADTAKRLASHISLLDSDTAYTYGLMHDVGKFHLKPREFYKHPRVGYELLKEQYPDIAEVCISHAFPDFASFEHMLRYCHDDKKEADAVYSILQGITRTSYIDLIQFCDKVSGVDGWMSLETKFDWYCSKDEIIHDEITDHYNMSLQAVKLRLDELVGEDVYGVLGIT
ncbi:MAG: HD domain-containing protein [Holosporales bacterium]|nr:HD domain-containing protein [Holosporales bacterium]